MIPSARQTRADGAATATASPSAPARNGAGMPIAPKRYYRQSLTWSTCGSLECAQVKVPLDYRHPGTSIELALVRRPATKPTERIGALVVNPGGPGASGIDYARAAEQSFSTDVLDHYDIVGFDPRGVGESDQVRCIGNAAMDTWTSMDVTPDTKAEVRALRSFDHAFARACLRHTGPLLGHVSTVESAADMDIIRAALGEPRLNFFGASYGTLLGATYAQEFPARVGRFVLDGALSTDLNSKGMPIAQAKGFETALDAFIADCVKLRDCPLGRRAGTARTKLADFLHRLDQHPLPTTSGRVLTQQQGETGVVTALYSKQTWVALRIGLRQAFAGNGATLLALADAYNGRDPTGSYADSLLPPNIAINCLDSGQAGTSVKQIEKQRQAYESAAPIFGDSARWSGLMCHDWPVRSPYDSPKLVAEGAAPIVVIGTTRDPATPYAWAKQMANTLASGVLLTRDGDGHTGYFKGDACIDSAVDAYLIDATVPKRGTRCQG